MVAPDVRAVSSHDDLEMSSQAVLVTLALDVQETQALDVLVTKSQVVLAMKSQNSQVISQGVPMMTREGGLIISLLKELAGTPHEQPSPLILLLVAQMNLRKTDLIALAIVHGVLVLKAQDVRAISLLRTSLRRDLPGYGLVMNPQIGNVLKVPLDRPKGRQW